MSGVLGALSPVARASLAAGGTGILIGGGGLGHGVERASEVYDGYAVKRWLTLSAEHEYVVDSAYNADREPVSIFARRVRTAFGDYG